MLAWQGFVSVAVGAVFGAWTRWLLALWLNSGRVGLPLGTLVANLSGGFAIGAIVAVLDQHPNLSPHYRLVLVTGFLGALTTFSTFSLESLSLLQRQQYAMALLHGAVHTVGSLAAAAAGYWLGSHWR